MAPENGRLSCWGSYVIEIDADFGWTLVADSLAFHHFPLSPRRRVVPASSLDLLTHQEAKPRGNGPFLWAFLDVDLSQLGPLLRLYRSGNEPVRLMRELQQQWGMDKWVGYYLNLA